ncbi:hypothetical protein EF888_08905 [Silicimonas algicola]|uniref:Uncharacterized protein n=1 Tax=Silicimonas algicola TaxID=1826607 RepID=A0A316G7G2_9RHOB|nr:hypothetical protein [Silicimonas algicola]AZQ67235.1 hypothetical protein EF888_08905 [Silicimonas algicola]PWK56899.1 hypothetical protein C8D95_103133 [Silicimonas algicola]
MTATTVTLVVMGAWALMLFVPSMFPALLMSAGFGVGIAYMMFLRQGGEGDLAAALIAVAPIAAGAVFVAWPVGAIFRWVLRSKRLR